MFGALKNKLKTWISGTKETVEESAERIETKEETTKEPPKKIEKPLKEEIKKEKKKKPIIKEKPEDADQLIKDTKNQIIPETPLKFEVGKGKYEPDPESIKEILVEPKKETQEKSKSFFSKLVTSFSYKITPEIFDEVFDELELGLLENNVALEVVEDLRKRLSGNLIGKEIKKQDLENEIKHELKKALDETLIEPDDPLDIIKLKDEKPFVILFFGINGTGKTTSIAKLTHLLKSKGFSIVLAAGDTFRAASIEQIEEHSKKLQVPLIKHNYQSDPAAVGFDAIKYAKNHNIDVVLIDTAGRMHTKTNLLAEMEKICRVTNPDLKIFVAESIAGNDATEQAKAFNDLIEIDGSILSKADIDEKGGTIISVSHITHKPIFYLGTGQNYEDLKLFDKKKFINDLGLE